MRSSFNQLLAALASFDLLYLFTMLLEGVNITDFLFSALLNSDSNNADGGNLQQKIIFFHKISLVCYGKAPP